MKQSREISLGNTDPAEEGAASWLRLDRQLCFPLYAASRLITRAYQPLLEPLGLTYTQYIVMLILWEESPCTVSDIGGRALLASNTLTPLLKRLEQQGLVTRTRASEDERVVAIALTDSGRALKARCLRIPEKLFARIGYPMDEALALKAQLAALIDRLQSLDNDKDDGIVTEAP